MLFSFVFSSQAQNERYFVNDLSLANYDSNGKYINSMKSCLLPNEDYFTSKIKMPKLDFNISSSSLITNFRWNTDSFYINSESLQDPQKKHPYIEDGFFGSLLKDMFLNYSR